MRYSEFQLLIRQLSRTDLIECNIEESYISDQAQKESVLIENLILNQPNTHVVKTRLLHEIDVCLKDFEFFESHARRELDRANKIAVAENERLGDDATGGYFRPTRHAPYVVVRSIISGVEEGLCIYVELLEKYFPDELVRFNPERIGYFLPLKSSLHSYFIATPSKISELQRLPTNLEQYNYWKDHIALHVQDLESASKYWGYPDFLLGRSENTFLNELGFIPERFREKLFHAWYWDKDVIHQIAHERAEKVLLPILTEELEKKIEQNSKYGLGDNEQLIKTELEKCDNYKVDLKPTDITLSIGGKYYFKLLYHEYYRAYLIERLDRLKNPQIVTPPLSADEPPTAYTFKDLLTEEGKKLLPFLKRKCEGANPSAITPILFALNDLTLTNTDLFKIGTTQLHKYLEASFGNIGKRQSLDASIKGYSSPDDYKRNKIEARKKEIKRILDL